MTSDQIIPIYILHNPYSILFTSILSFQLPLLLITHFSPQKQKQKHLFIYASSSIIDPTTYISHYRTVTPSYTILFFYEWMIFLSQDTLHTHSKPPYAIESRYIYYDVSIDDHDRWYYFMMKWFLTHAYNDISYTIYFLVHTTSWWIVWRSMSLDTMSWCVLVESPEFVKLQVLNDHRSYRNYPWSDTFIHTHLHIYTYIYIHV